MPPEYFWMGVPAGSLPRADHPSNRMTDTQVSELVVYHTPDRPKPCQYCQWPGTFAGLCMVCQALGEAINLMRSRIYWLQVAASEQAERRVR